MGAAATRRSAKRKPGKAWAVPALMQTAITPAVESPARMHAIGEDPGASGREEQSGLHRPLPERLGGRRRQFRRRLDAIERFPPHPKAARAQRFGQPAASFFARRMQQ